MLKCWRFIFALLSNSARLALAVMPYTHRRAGALIPAQHVESRHDSVSLRLATWDAIATLRVAYRLVAFRSSTSAWLHASAYVWPLIEGPHFFHSSDGRPLVDFRVSHLHGWAAMSRRIE